MEEELPFNPAEYEQISKQLIVADRVDKIDSDFAP